MKTILTTTIALGIFTILGNIEPAEARRHRHYSSSVYFNAAPAVSYYAPPPVAYAVPYYAPQPAVTYYAPPPPQPMYYSQPVYAQPPCYDYIQPGLGFSFRIF
ncbi:MAG TPA: hypothetical protein VMW10_10290 [Alphaproteobacteria bacterium]|nr:hypothetical protein [Alphaproteobacteria bacterium]